MIQLSATSLITAITVLCTLYAWNKPEIQDKWMFNPYKVAERKEYYRFITSGFIHADQLHLMFNMFAFYSFGQVVEIQIFQELFGRSGSLIFTIMYLLGIIVSDLPSYIKYRHTSLYNSLGASGGVSSVIFAFILFSPLSQLSILFFLNMPGFIFGALYMAYSFYMAKRGGDNINHDAHIWGAIFGVVFCVLVYPEVLERFIQQISRGY